jgi:RND family efflux transporter MFP subunit
MRRVWLMIIGGVVVVAVALVAGGWWVGWWGAGDGEGTGGGEGGAAPPRVAVVLVRGEELVQRREWGGVTEALRRVPVQASAGGRVVGLEVGVGERVSGGEELLRIEDPALMARLPILRERAELLEGELAEWEALAAAGAAGAAELSAARLEVLAAREVLAEVEARVESGVLRAPEDARVVELGSASGVEVAGGQVLLVLEALGGIGLRLRLPVSELRWLEEGEVRMWSGEGEEIELPGRWRALADGEAFVVVEWEGLAVGGEVEVRLVSELRSGGLLVPWTAVASDGGEHWVMVVDGGGKLVRRLVELGRAGATGVEVIGGLEDGERVVRYRPRAWAEGREVEAVEAVEAVEGGEA